MATPTAMERFGALPATEPVGDYNFEHFRASHLIADGRRTLRNAGITPGELAPDFELPQAGGGKLQLVALRGRPVLLHFGSFT